MTTTGFTGGWFTDGDAPQGHGQQIPGQSGFYVLLMQLTILDPDLGAGVSGTFTLAWKTASSSVQFSDVDFYQGVPPAPGTVALMGVAALIRSRRDR